ncbi:hypothetical protein UPYG_G00237260 [Umbra pygmaea]|uniref:C-type lectin domain-containing protein n=1 Tax=Umbra pygmaea TaxID=75934 RepID=A0ABD0WEK8_UMBPY
MKLHLSNYYEFIFTIEATDPDEDVTYSEVRTGVKEQVNPGKGREPCCDELSSPVESKFVTPERGCWRFAMVILVCLCVVLLGLTITLGILYALQRTDFQVAEATFLAHISQMKENITELQQSKTNVTAVNNNLTSINAQLQTKIQNCTSNLTEVNNLLAIAQAKHCSSDWIFFNGSCYYFSNDIMTWKQSKYACIRDGGHLVIIESLQEQEFLRIKVGNPDYADSPWIGMTDQNTEGTWVWVDNTTLNNNNK